MNYVGLFKLAKLAFNVHRIATESSRQVRRLATEVADELGNHVRELDQQVQSLDSEGAGDDFDALTDCIAKFLRSPSGTALYRLLPSRFVTEETGTQAGIVMFVAMHTMFRAGFIEWDHESDKFGPRYVKLFPAVATYFALNLGKPSNYAFGAGPRRKRYRDYLHAFAEMLCMASYFYGIGARRRLAHIDDLPPGEWARRKLQHIGLLEPLTGE